MSDNWQEYAACYGNDTNAWFPDKGGSTKDARRICATCPVRQQCLDYSIDNDIRFGVWGGVTETDRRTMLANKRRVTAA